MLAVPAARRIRCLALARHSPSVPDLLSTLGLGFLATVLLALPQRHLESGSLAIPVLLAHIVSRVCGWQPPRTSHARIMLVALITGAVLWIWRAFFIPASEH